MDLNKLKTFHVLGTVKSYSRCAERMHVTQSAVSHTIRSLEQSIGVDLVQRQKKEFTLTDEGELLFESCKGIFSELEQTTDHLLKRRDYPESIKLGCTIEVGSKIIIRAMNRFFLQHPKTHIDFTLGFDLLPKLLNDDLDVIIDCQTQVHPDLRKFSLFEKTYSIIATPAYIEQQDIRTLQDLERCNILSVDRSLKWWRPFWESAVFDTAPDVDRITEINSVQGIISASLSAIGVGCVPTFTVKQYLADGHLVALFPEIEIQPDQVSLYIKKHKSSQPKYTALINYITQFDFKGTLKRMA